METKDDLDKKIKDLLETESESEKEFWLSIFELLTIEEKKKLILAFRK